MPRSTFVQQVTDAIKQLWALANEPRATDERMMELLEPYRPQRRRAIVLIKLSGIHAPRYGPRSPQSAIGQDG